MMADGAVPPSAAVKGKDHVMETVMNRRLFLRTTAGAAGFLILSSSRSAFGFPANEKVNVALVGVDGRGDWFTKTMPRISNVVAMCDVNDRRAARQYETIPAARRYQDFRRMLDEMDKDIDAVTVATPDNTHAVITAAAIRRGKAVLTEKPLTHDVFEARTLRDLARRHKVATQMGNQGTASRAFREAVALIQAGSLGEIREVHAWNTGGGAGDRPIPTDKHDLPDYIHWDLWLGPAQWREYNTRWFAWHTWRDFATGQLGNWGCHTMNVFFKGLRLDTLWSADNPDGKNNIRLTPRVSEICKGAFPKWEIIEYDFPARGDMPPVKVHWYNGGGEAPGPRKMIEEKMGRPLDWGDAGRKQWADHAGCLIIGSEGMLHSNGHNTEYTLYPQEKFRDMPRPETIRSRGHENEWLDAVKGGPAAMSSFDYAAPLTEYVLLGNIATLVGERIEFDPAAMKIINHQAADNAIRRQYRAGWTL